MHIAIPSVLVCPAMSAYKLVCGEESDRHSTEIICPSPSAALYLADMTLVQWTCSGEPSTLRARRALALPITQEGSNCGCPRGQQDRISRTLKRSEEGKRGRTVIPLLSRTPIFAKAWHNSRMWCPARECYPIISSKIPSFVQGISIGQRECHDDVSQCPGLDEDSQFKPGV